MIELFVVSLSVEINDTAVRVVTDTHTRTHARTHARSHARTHARSHARMHARTHTRITWIKEQSLVTMPPLAKLGFPVRYSGSRACANTNSLEPARIFFWTHFRLSLWREVLLRMRSVNCHGNVQMN